MNSKIEDVAAEILNSVGTDDEGETLAYSTMPTARLREWSAIIEREFSHWISPSVQPSSIAIDRAGGTIPSCDRVLLAFAMTLAQKHGWTTVRLCEFLAQPWNYQKEWGEWLHEQRWAEPKVTTEEIELP